MDLTEYITDIINKRVFYGDFYQTFYRSMWRMTCGSRTKAFETIRATLKHYTNIQVSDAQLDNILGELNGGCEIEWLID